MNNPLRCAKNWQLRIPFSVCDMREAFRHHGGGALAKGTMEH
jgi:hypothetical protein